MTMITFFLILRAVRAAYKGLRALIGIAIVSHGAYQWAKAKRAT
jgi:hypothetical protein